jgi:fatty acid desaturase
MNRFKAIYFPALIISITLFILGQIVFVSLFEFFEPKVPGILFEITEQDRIVKTSVLFSLTLALIPILVAFIFRFAPIASVNKKVTTVLIIFIFIIAAIFVRHFEVKIYFTRVVKPSFLMKNIANKTYPIDPVNFVYYMLGGLFIGSIVSYFLFRNR